MLQSLAAHFSLEEFVSNVTLISGRATIITSLFEGLATKFVIQMPLEDVILGRLQEAFLNDSVILDLMTGAIADAISAFRNHSILSPGLTDAVSGAISIGLQKPVFEAIDASLMVHCSTLIAENFGAVETVAVVQSALKREIELTKLLPTGLANQLLLRTRDHLYVGRFHRDMQQFVDQFLDRAPINYHAISQFAGLITASENVQLNDAFIEAVSKYSIRMCGHECSRCSFASVSDLTRLLAVFRDLVDIYHVSQFEYAIKYFRDIVNRNGRQTIDLVNRFIHQQMVKHDERFLSSISGILFFIQQLDIDNYFFYCFRQLLSIRLVASYSTSPAVRPEINRDEIQLLTELRKIFTNTQYEALNRTIQDMRSSPEAIATFRYEHPINFRVMFLSVEVWPSFPRYGLSVMPLVSDARAQFETFCHETFPNRIVTWIDSLESCVFVSQEITIIASAAQTMLFYCIVNDRDPSETGLPSEIQKEGLTSLVTAGLLVKKRESFRLAPRRPGKRVLRINTYSRCFPERHAELSEDELFRRRRPLIESAIARVLKSSGPLSIGQLFRESAAFYRFPLTSEDFHECLTMLLARVLIVKTYDNQYCSCSLF
jgi:hypothetical protein